ncbi:MAG: penicillin-binding protein 2 [Thermoanaerobaculia bacterium]
MKKENFLLGVLFLSFLMIIFRYYSLQIRKGRYYEEMALKNHIRQVIIPAYRGTLWSRENFTLAKNEVDYDLLFYAEESKDPERVIKDLIETLPLRKEEILQRWKGRNLSPSYIPITLIPSLDPEELPLIEEFKIKYREVSIHKTLKREYPFSEYMSHVVGYISEASQQDIAENPNLRQGEWVGKTGLEKSYDNYLKGKDEIWQVIVDSREKEVSRYLLRKGKTGKDLKTFLSLNLHKKAKELFGEQRGAAFLFNLKNGSVYLYFSSPSKKIMPPISSKAKNLWRELFQDPSLPLLDRVSQGTYPPGSVFKVILAVAALEEGIWSPEKIVNCSGSFKFGNRIFKCWNPKGHGAVNLKRAIVESCDVYFYNLGLFLGLNRIEKWARIFEIDKRTELDLFFEKPGFVPSERWSMTVRKVPWFAGETVSLSIGQGPVLVTPLKVAQIYGVFATGGKLIFPSLNPLKGFQHKDLNISESTLNFIKESLTEVVKSPSGTGHRIYDFPIIAGKTGTAQVMSEEKGKPYIKEHSWFVGFAPAEDPEYVCVAIVENAGHGSEVAAPIVKELLYGLLK